MATNYPTSLDVFTNPGTSSALNSPSHAGQHSDINDAVEALQAKLGVGDHTVGDLQTWTPTFNFCSLGNGSYTAEYVRINDFVFFSFFWTLGSTSTISSGVRIGLPVQASSAQGYFNTWAMATDISAGVRHMGMAYLQESGANARPAVYSSSSSTVRISSSFSNTTPFTWASGDQFWITGVYRAA